MRSPGPCTRACRAIPIGRSASVVIGQAPPTRCCSTCTPSRRPLYLLSWTMQYFTTQLSGHQQTAHSLRASQYRPAKKRRRSDDDDDADSSSPEPEARPESTPAARPYASHDSLEIAQLRVAGLLPGNDASVPSLPFPHAPARVASERYGASKIQEEIAKPPARLYAVNAVSKGDSLNKQSETTLLRKAHLDVLSTVMHRCLLEGDYERAGRAWGMLLRTQVAGGQPVDPRNHGRWGIGAEVLLRREPRTASEGSDALQPDPHSLGQDVFSEEGFELAREYFERLIIQHPNRKTTPHSIDERNFYPAMISLWIFEVCEKSKRARRQMRKDAQQPRSRSTSLDSVMGEDHSSDDLRAREDAVQVEELTRAMEIAERLDQLVASPPFDRQASLLQLRGHICLWISTLRTSKTNDDDDDDDDWDMDATERLDESNLLSAAEQLTQLNSCQRDLQQAQQFLFKAESHGAPPQKATMASIEIKLRQLARQLAKLRTVGED
jgi:hypothetical protein